MTFVLIIVLIIMIVFIVVAIIITFIINIIIIIIINIMPIIFAQVHHRNHSNRSKCSTRSIRNRNISRISSLALLLTGCICVAIVAAQHVNSAPVTPVGTWATAALSVGRGGLAATSLPNEGLAIFAGGTCA